MKQNYRNQLWRALLFIALNAVFLNAQAALPNDGSVKLTITAGVGFCSDGGTYPDCDQSRSRVGSGSFFLFDALGNGEFILSAENEIILGITQNFSGKVDAGNIVNQWLWAGQYGTNWTTDAIMANNDGSLDMSGWRATRGTEAEINLGAGTGNVFSCTDSNGVARLVDDCQIGDSYTLDYTAIASTPGGTSAFERQPYTLHLEGLITQRDESILFEEVTAAAQLDTSTTNSAAANLHGGGLAWFDYNNDGWQDLYRVTRSKNTARPNQLYRNNADGSFTLVTPANLQLLGVNSKSVGIGDINNDGWDDIFVGTEGTNKLFKNNQDGTFTDVSSMGIDQGAKNSVSVSFGDIDGDGDLDLYIGNETRTLDSTDGNASNDYYQNRFVETGLLGFQLTDVGLADDQIASARATFAGLMTDYDNDNDLDLYVINDFGRGHAMYQNQGVDGNGLPVFIEDTLSGLDAGAEGMGIAAGDVNGDGLLDYYVTNIGGLSSPNNLLINDNNGRNSFTDKSLSANVAGGGVDWGTAFFDADNDGDVDLYVGQDAFSGGGRNFFYRNDGKLAFTNIRNSSMTGVEPGLGLALADYDRDGRVDMAIQGKQGQLMLLRNRTKNSQNYLRVKLNGALSNHRGIGAKIRVNSHQSANPSVINKQIREIHSGSSHASVHEFTQHIGLGADDRADIEVTWPNACEQIVSAVSINQLQTVAESNCLSTVEGFDFPYGARLMQINGTNLRNVILTVAGVAVADEQITYVDDDGDVTGKVVFATLPKDISGQVVLSTPYTSNIVVGNYVVPPPGVLSIDVWTSSTNAPSLTVISGGNFLTVTDVKINGQTAAIYNKSSNTSITVVGINATAVNTVSVTTVEEGTVTLNAQPAISSVVAAVPSIWSTVSGSGFKFGVSSVRVNGVSVGWQLNTDGSLLVIASVSSINATKLEVVTSRGIACFGSDCP